MAAQASDVVHYEAERYSLAGVCGTGLFDPGDYPLMPRPFSTANWRGFRCRYDVHGVEWFLDALFIGLDKEETAQAERGEGPFLLGVPPLRVDRFEGVVYESIREPIRFTGGLLLGRDFMQELYVHMGIHPAWKFKHVIELLIKYGRVHQARDHSQAAEYFRRSLQPGDLRRGISIDDRGRMEEWIRHTFSLEYRRDQLFSLP